MLIALALACGSPEPAAPLGMALLDDGRVYAGAAVIDITPEIPETFIDHDGDGEFGGCLDEPEVGLCGSGDGFVDADGDGWFDAVWIAGYGPYRPAQGVRDPITARAIVLAQDGEYIAFVSLDLVGLGHPRIHQARERLALLGFDRDRLLVASTHNHQGPDSMGLWGDPESFPPVSGLDPAYQQRVAEAIEAAVRQAAGSMERVDLHVGAVDMRSVSPWLNGAAWGGKNPVDITHGMVYDGRDPVLVSDQLLAVQGVGSAGTVFTWTVWSGHPEVRGSDNHELSADWVGATREALEARYGGIALHSPESLGGMQSALHADLPLLDDQGGWVFQTCDAAAVADPEDAECFGLSAGAPRVDADGDAVPAWAEQDSWEFVHSHGWLIANAAIEVLDAAPTYDLTPLEVDVEPIYVPVDNVAYNLLGTDDVFELGLEDALTDTALCPEAVDPGRGCLEVNTFRGRMGPISFATAPGEILPEVSWGLPSSEPTWDAESADPTARGDGSLYFPQHDHDCDAVEYTACQEAFTVNDCDCLAVHVWPYAIAHDPALPPMLDGFDTEFRIALSMTDSYLSYVVPEPDFNHKVSLFTDDGDHYEDTVAPWWLFATRVLEAHDRMRGR